MEYIFQHLKQVPILAVLKAEYLETLAKVAILKRYDKGEVIIRQGEPGRGLFIILNGMVQVTRKISPNLKEARLNVLGKGDFFGEMSLLDGYPRSASVTALTPTEVVELNRWDFLEALNHNPGLGVALLPVLCRRIRYLETEVRHS
jgi:CRP-like cAMP-binding protein